MVGKSPERPFQGLFDVRVPPDLHGAAAERAAKSGTTLNEIVTQALANYLASPMPQYAGKAEPLSATA